MIEQAARFGPLLLSYRHRRSFSQQEVAEKVGIYPSDLSKIEREKKEPPRASVVLKLAEVLQLSHAETLEFVTIAGYSEAILERAQFNPSKYPSVTKEVVEQKLQGLFGRWPVFVLDTDGQITLANLLAFRLLGALTEQAETLDSATLLGKNLYLVLIRPENFQRIAMPAQENDFWYTILAIWNKLKDTVPTPIRTVFETVIKTQPILKLILDYGQVNIEQEWKQHLAILPSGSQPSDDDPGIYLHFSLEVERILEKGEHQGYLISARPLKTYTQERTDREYSRLINIYTKENFVQREADTHQREEEEKYPSFFPAVHHDQLWIINFENSEFILLFDKETRFSKNKHYFEMLLDPIIIERMGGFQGKKLIIPIRHFLQDTKDFSQNERYKQIKAHLLSMPIFQALLTELWAPPDESVSLSVQKEPCFSIQIDNPLREDSHLTFDVVTRKPYDRETDYRVTFIPTTTTTKASLILLRLLSHETFLSLLAGNEQEQLEGLIALLQTMREGFTKKKGKNDWGWHPEQAFGDHYGHLTTTKQKMPKTSETLKQQALWELSQYLFEDEKRQGDLLSLLLCFVEDVSLRTSFLSDFLSRISLPT